MSDQQLKNVSFEVVRYANCWEDAELLLKALDPDENSKIMGIASAGDNCFSLLTANPKQVIAVDVSAVQLYLCELKMAAIRLLSRDEYMAFAGFEPSDLRTDVYQNLRHLLSEDCAAYWDKLPEQIKGGVIHFGKFEQYFQLFRKDYLLPIHDQNVINELFRPKSADEQCAFHDNVWHNAAYDKMYRFFFGEQMMGERGRDPEFLKHVEGTVADLVMAQEMKHLRTAKAQKNYFLYYMVNNRFENQFTPHYVREENYPKIKANLDKLILHKGLLDSATKKYPDCTHFNLSDIFEYMDQALFTQVSRQLLDNSSPHAKFAYWNLMVPRNMATVFPDELAHNQQFCHQIKEDDMGYFYRSFVTNEKK